MTEAELMEQQWIENNLPPDEPQGFSPMPVVQQPASLPVPANDGAAILSVIAQAAKDPAMDVIKLEKLMDLHERILNRNAKAEFSADYVRMKPHLPTVARTKTNKHTNSNYAPLEEINETVDPILEKYGFGTATKVLSQTLESVTVRAELWHRGGHIEETTITMPLDNKGTNGTVNKTGPHATASSITYAKRVAVCALLNISTGDDVDGNKRREDSEYVDIDFSLNLEDWIVKEGIDRSVFLTFIGYPGFADTRKILARDIGRINAAVAAHNKKKENAKKAVKNG